MIRTDDYEAFEGKRFAVVVTRMYVPGECKNQSRSGGKSAWEVRVHRRYQGQGDMIPLDWPTTKAKVCRTREEAVSAAKTALKKIDKPVVKSPHGGTS